MRGRALITGATGFAGSRLAAYLAERGWEVVRCGYPVRPGDDALPFDVTQVDQMASVLDEAGAVSHVFHLAAVTFVPEAANDPETAFDVNLQGTVRLLDAVARHCPKARFLFVSTADAYGAPQRLPMDEGHPLNPANPYAISKAAADLYCGFVSHAENRDIVRLRPFNHSGPGQSDQFVLSSFARQIAEIESGKKAPVLRVGNLEAIRDFLHVEDVLSAYEVAATQGAPGAVYNICSGQGVKIQAALDAMLAMSTATIAVEPDPARMRPSDVAESVGSHAAFTEAAGWRPRRSFDSLLEDLLGYWRAETRNLEL